LCIYVLSTGLVNFNKFLFWWSSAHSGGKRGSHYTARFKLIHAKVQAESFNVDKVITQPSGSPGTLEYRLNFYYKQESKALKPISPWHDIPLYRVGSGSTGQIYNFVCEIPKYTRAKYECSTGEVFNPIKQDTQHGKLRFYKHGDIMFNYGFFPQTWEDPNFIPADTLCPGDNDPLDVLEIGAKQIFTGDIVAVKILGVLALIDDGETDCMTHKNTNSSIYTPIPQS
jgi:inorganic pyrophosphatase